MMEDKPMLELEAVSLKPGPEFESGLESVSFAVRPGERILIHLEPPGHRGTFGDLALGLTEPDDGRVLFQGRNWQHMAPGTAAAARARIGRVCERPLWVSNLDVDENITLVQRHFTVRPEAEIDVEAVTLARLFGLEDLPRMRPARVRPRDLPVADWIRALLGERALLVLDRPLRDAPSDKAPVLVQAARSASDKGTAVIWLQDAGDPNIVKEFEPARMYRVAGERLSPLERM